MSIDVARSKAEAIAKKCSLVLSNIPLFIESFPEKESLFDRDISEPEIRGLLAKLREIYDTIEESPLVSSAGEEYLSKHSLYKTAEENPSQLEDQIRLLQSSSPSTSISALKSQIHDLTEANENLEKELERMNLISEDEQQEEMRQQELLIDELREAAIAHKQNQVNQFKDKIENRNWIKAEKEQIENREKEEIERAKKEEIEEVLDAHDATDKMQREKEQRMKEIEEKMMREKIEAEEKMMRMEEEMRMREEIERRMKEEMRMREEMELRMLEEEMRIREEMQRKGNM